MSQAHGIFSVNMVPTNAMEILCMYNLFTQEMKFDIIFNA